MKRFFLNSEGKIKWWINGLIFFVVCYVIAVILVPLLTKGTITQKELLIGVPVWAIGGFVYSFIMKIATERKK